MRGEEKTAPNVQADIFHDNLNKKACTIRPKRETKRKLCIVNKNSRQTIIALSGSFLFLLATDNKNKYNFSFFICIYKAKYCNVSLESSIKHLFRVISTGKFVNTYQVNWSIGFTVNNMIKDLFYIQQDNVNALHNQMCSLIPYN